MIRNNFRLVEREQGKQNWIEFCQHCSCPCSGWHDDHCMKCIHNPYTLEEIANETAEYIKSTKRYDKFIHYKKGNYATQHIGGCEYCRDGKKYALEINNTFFADVISIKNSDFIFCPFCGKKIKSLKEVIDSQRALKIK